MRASDLKNKYPTLWSEVNRNMLGLIHATTSTLTDKEAEVMAHNAAFIACSELHKIITR